MLSLAERRVALENNTHKNPLNKKKIVLFVVYSIVAICLFMTVLSINDLDAISKQLESVKMEYVWYALLMIIAFALLFPLSLCILTKARGTNIKMSTTYAIAMTEHFFNGITPLSTGGQPFQAYSYYRAKVKLSESTGLLLTNLLVYMIVTSAFALVGLFYFDVFLLHMDKWWAPVVIIGYILDILILVITFALGASKTIRNLLIKLINAICKLRLFRKLQPKAKLVEEYFEQVQEAFHYLTKKKGAFALALLSKVVAYAFYYGASYFILLAFGIPMQPKNILLSISATAFAITAVGFIPTPGASGGVEGAMGQIYRSIVIFITGGAIFTTATAVANGVMLIWRLLSYYLLMLISLAFYIGLEIVFNKKSQNIDALTEQNAENGDIPPATKETE